MSDAKGFYSSKYDIKKEPQLKEKLAKAGFSFKEINHAFWSAQKGGITATLYKSGKILVQGKDIDNFTNEFIENKPATTKSEPIQKPEYTSWIGTDESGKGDYFGPLVIAGVLVDENNIKKLQELKVKDSKKINDETIEKLAIQIKASSTFSVVTITPAKYNQLYEKIGNLNNLLAWGHARAIENILEKKPCQNALSDKFGNESLIKNALMTKGKTINLEQRVRAEEDIAVAAASILARNEFVQRIKSMSREYGINFQKGAGEKVKEQAKEFVAKNGVKALSNIAKMHFKTTKEVCQ
jgi:ribonuclease HIII